MADLSLGLIVLRTVDLDGSLEFYGALGLTFVEEQHGSGPIHSSTTPNGLVIELYPGKPYEKIDYRNGGATMIGFSVASIEPILAALARIEARLITPPKSTQRGIRAVVEDPDGRAVEINQSPIH